MPGSAVYAAEKICHFSDLTQMERNRIAKVIRHRLGILQNRVLF